MNHFGEERTGQQEGLLPEGMVPEQLTMLILVRPGKGPGRDFRQDI